VREAVPHLFYCPAHVATQLLHFVGKQSSPPGTLLAHSSKLLVPGFSQPRWRDAQKLAQRGVDVVSKLQRGVLRIVLGAAGWLRHDVVDHPQAGAVVRRELERSRDVVCVGRRPVQNRRGPLWGDN